MKLVYIASPYAGDIPNNVERAKEYCKQALEQGVVPVAPHLLYPQFLEDSDPAERNLGLRAGLELLSRCEEMWVFGEEISPGMSREIQFAQGLGIPIRQWELEAGMERGAFPMTLGSLFDGIAGFPLAASKAGIETIWASEIEPFPIAVSQFHFSKIQQVGDITKLCGADLPPVDIICGGSPCQDLSVAGARAGLAGERSGLFLHQIRIIKEMRDADIRHGRTDEFVRPRWMLWENVPGAFSSGQPRGEDFRAVLEETARVVDPACYVPRPAKGKWLGSGYLLADGFSIAWRTVDAQFFGVPQRRRRIALVADFAGLCAPEILFIENGLQRYYPPGQSTAEAIARSLAAST